MAELKLYTHCWCTVLHTTTVLRPFFRDHPDESVPEENFWCKGRLEEADTPTIQLGATPSGLTSAHLHHPLIIFTGGCPSCRPNNSVEALKATSAFGLGRRRSSSPQRCYLHHLRTVLCTVLCTDNQADRSMSSVGGTEADDASPAAGTHCCLVAIGRLQVTSSPNTSDLAAASSSTEFISRHSIDGKFTFVDHRLVFDIWTASAPSAFRNRLKSYAFVFLVIQYVTSVTSLK